MENRLIPIATETDTQLSLQIVNTTTTRGDGTTTTSKELGILLSTEIGTDEDGEQIAILSRSGVEDLIEELTSLKELLTK